jgi:spore coat protein U-like protein
MRNAILILLLGLLLLPGTSLASSCAITTTGVSFGNYDPFSTQPLDSTGSINVHCDATTSFTVSLSPGQGTYSTRFMLSGAHTLTYNLYTDATYTTIWGDGSGATSQVSGTSDAPLAIYGHVRAGQNAYVGTYGDSIVVSVVF